MDQVGFLSRAKTQVYDKVSITVAVPSKDEAIELFDRKLYKKGVQPVWVKIRNDYDIPIIFMLLHMDQDYYSPAEASFKTRFKSSKKLSLEKDRYFQEVSFPGLTVPPGEEYSGFVFVNLDEGTKSVVVTLMGRHQMKTFVFIVPVPGFDADYLTKDIDSIYSEDEYIVLDDEDSLRAALENLPRSVKNAKGTAEGDPLNLVLVGEFVDIIAAFTRSGWDETHVLKTGSAIKTATAFIFGSTYRYSPISDLYVFGRSQDVSFQKARKTTHERNHMRFWKTHYRTETGKSVWIGQISRDIGVKWTTKTGGVTTHVVDADVDNDRNYVFQNLIDAQAVNAIGFVKGPRRRHSTTPVTIWAVIPTSQTVCVLFFCWPTCPSPTTRSTSYSGTSHRRSMITRMPGSRNLSLRGLTEIRGPFIATLRFFRVAGGFHFGSDN